MEYKSYYCELENVQEQLDKYGVAVIKNIINENECNEYIEKAWKNFNILTSKMKNPILKNKPETWKTIYELYPLHSMLLQHWGVGQWDFLWDIRCNKNVNEVFAKIWNCETNDLLTSFDGLSFHLPPEQTGRGWYRGNDWLHTDQSSEKKGLYTVQGFVTLFNINKYDASLCIFEGSHKSHESFFKDHNIIEKKDWFRLQKEIQYEYLYNKGHKKVCVLAEKGSIVLWDSRLFHQGIEPQRERTKTNTRLIVYTCMTNRTRARPCDLKKKQKAFNEQRMTTHCPHKPILFSKIPRTYGNELPKITMLPKVELNEIGKRLAGF